MGQPMSTIKLIGNYFDNRFIWFLLFQCEDCMVSLLLYDIKLIIISLSSWALGNAILWHFIEQPTNQLIKKIIYSYMKLKCRLIANTNKLKQCYIKWEHFQNLIDMGKWAEKRGAVKQKQTYPQCEWLIAAVFHCLWYVTY